MKPIPGLSDWSNAIVSDILDKYPEAQPIVLFGSRAKGTFRNGSDIDLAIMGQCDSDLLYRIQGDFEDSYLPYFVDVLAFSKLKNQSLKDHIKRVGITL
ncbi:MAG: nucleotidyltransferase domain-containing protein [Bacteroidales bacterium]|nr:nucleotidyltransferase domain-containing protein [Bacteroidales bacterium]